MARDPEYFEPKTIVKGEKLHWKRSFADYPATLWTLQYRFRGNTGAGFDVTASADGSDHEVQVAATVTNDLAAETYSWQAWLTEIADSNNTFLVEHGTVEVEAGFVSGTTTAVDQRTENEKILEALQAVISGKATEDQWSYKIESGNGSRELRKMPWTELIKAEMHYRNLVGREKRARKLKEGGSVLKSYGVRMRGNP